MENPQRKYKYYHATPAQFRLIKPFARKNRKNPTPAERALWHRIKNGRLGGFLFRRQHITDRYIVDFVCLQKLLVVEVDGEYHFHGSMPERDRKRTCVLQSYEFRVIRFTNEEVLHHIDKVLKEIMKHLLNP